MTPRHRQRGSHPGRWWWAAALAAIVVAALAASAVPGIGANHPRSPVKSGDVAASGSPQPLATAKGYTVDAIRSGAFTTETPEPAFLRDKHDDAGHVSYAVGALKVTPPTRLPVYLIGGSNVRECVESAATFQAAITDAAGVATSVINLSSCGQNLGTTMAIVDNLPLHTGGVVVISVNGTRFSYSPTTIAQQIQGAPVLARSDALQRFVLKTIGVAPANTILPGINAYLAGWQRQNATTLAAGLRPWHVYHAHRYAAGRLWTDAAKRARVRRWLHTKGLPDGEFHRFHAFNEALLVAITRVATARGYSVVLMETPADLAIIGTAFDPYQAAYVPVCKRIARSVGGQYVDLNKTVGLVNGDFHDPTHLVEPGRAKWETGLAAAIAPLLQRATGTPGASPSP